MSSETPSPATDSAIAASAWGASAAAAASGWVVAAASSVVAWKPQLPYRNRPKPRSFGTGKFGVDKFDSRDNTRYAWGRVVPPVLAAFFALLSLAAPARAVNTYCEGADALTTTYGFCKPAVDVEGATPWGTKYNYNFSMVDSQFGSIGSSTAYIFSILNAVGVSTAAQRADFSAFVSTAGPLISTLGQSTETLRSSLDLFKSTAGPLISTLGQSTGTFNIWMGTITPNIAALNVSTAALSVSTAALSVSTAAMRASFNAYISTNGPLVSTLGVSTETLRTTKLSSPTVSGVAGQVVALGSDGTPTWTTIASASLGVTTCTVGAMSTTFTNTTFAVALTTVTFTTTGHKVKVTLNASGCNTAAYSGVYCSFMIDGVLNHTSLIGDSMQYQSNICADEQMFGFTAVTITAPSAASHGFGLVCRVGGSTGKINQQPTSVSPQFCAEEVP